ncbi:hypothetical protein QJQ45_027720, partial [Haematococcus lacustris]
ALNIAKTFPELAAAIEAYKQENEDVVTTPSSKSTTRAGNDDDLVKLIVDCNLPFNIVDNPTFKTFLATWVPAMPVPSRDQVSRILDDLCLDPLPLHSMPTFEPWWELNSCLVELMVPVAQLLTAIQADHANFADVHYGLVMPPVYWSDRRSRLLLGRMWIMSYVFFNTRVMTRKEHHASAEAQEEWENFMAAQVVLDAPQL